MIAKLIARELRRAFSGAAWLPIAFFLLVVAMVPFAVGPDAKILTRIAGGIMWVAALTAALLPVERLIEPDRADGVFDQLVIHGVPDEVVAVSRIIGHWLAFGPLLLVALFPAGALLGLKEDAFQPILISLAVGTPGLAALAVCVAALTSGLPRAGSVAGLLMLPLAVPLVIFGASAAGGNGDGALQLEAAVSLLFVAGGPFLTAAALRAARS